MSFVSRYPQPSVSWNSPRKVLSNYVMFVALLASPDAQGFVTTRLASPRAYASFVSSTRKTSLLKSESSEDSDPTEEDGIGVGIDLGTTYSCVSVLVDGIPTIIPIPNNGRTMPSVVGFDSGNRILVGGEAIENEVENPTGSYRNVKRVIGTGGLIARETADVVPNLVTQSVPEQKGGGGKNRKKKKKDRPNLLKQIQDAQQNPAALYLPQLQGQENNDRETIAPEVISSHVVRALLDAAERHTGKKVTRAVVGVPAYFHDEQRDATVRACQMAGVSKVKLLREPEAAALAYGIGKEQIGQGDDDELVLVFDLGGGTYDVSVLDVGGGITEVIATGGNTLLGGSDFDARIAQHFATVLKDHGIQRNFVTAGGEVADAMVRSAEAVRIYLSNNRVANLALPLTEEGWYNMPHAADLIMDAGTIDSNMELTEEGVSNSTHILCQLSRKSMERLCQEEFQALLRPVREVAIMAGALLPGDSRPSIVEAALEYEEEMDRAIGDAGGGAAFEFGEFYRDEEKELAAAATKADPSELEDVDPDILLQLQELDVKEKKRLQQKGRKKARNVAKQERKFRQEKRKVDTTTVSDVKVRDGITGRPISQVVLVGGATRMPAIGRLLAAVTGVVPQKTVNPDEAVALGCAVHAGVLDGNKDLGDLMVLTPMQAAIMRAVAVKNGLHLQDDSDFEDDFDEQIFGLRD